MAFTNAVKEAAVANVISTATHLSLHTADPGTTGASEQSATGGYARQAISWTAGASDGSTVGTAETFTVPAGTYTHVGLWTAATAGTFIGGFALSSNAVLSAAGEVVVTPTVTVAG